MKLVAFLDDPFELFAAQRASAGQLSIRSWPPADDATWTSTKPCGDWGSADFGLTRGSRPAYPMLGVPSLLRQLCPRGNTEHVDSFPSFTAPAAQVSEFLM